MDEVGPEGPRYVEVGLDEALAVGEETVEIAGQELADVEQIAVDMTEDGVLGVVQARLEDVADDVLEGLGVVDAGEVDDGLVGGGLARHLTDELLGLGIEGGTGLHLGDLTEETDDEPAHLALRLVEGAVLLQLTADAPADGVALAVEVVGETLDGVVDEPAVAEAETLEVLAQGTVHRLALIGGQPVGDPGHQTAGRGEAGGTVDTAAEDDDGAGGRRLRKGDGRPVIVVDLHGLRGRGYDLRMAA